VTQRQRFKGGFITTTEVDPTATVATGVWTLSDVALNAPNDIWPTVPDAPTIGTVTLSGGNGASIPFTNNNLHGASFVNATAISNCGSFSDTGSSSPLSVSGLTQGDAYTFTVTTTTDVGTSASSAVSNEITADAPTGQEEFGTAGTYSWTAPSGVTKVSIVAMGAGSNGGQGGGASSGGGGGGGGLGYKNNYPVSPGSSYTVVVGDHGLNGYCMSGTDSYFVSTGTVKGGGSSHTNRHSGGSGGNFTGDGGANGGGGGGGTLGGGDRKSGGGGGGAGYTGNGGNGGGAYSAGSAGAACSGAGGGGGGRTNNSTAQAGRGGSVGLEGKGATGAGGTSGGGAGGSGSGSGFGGGGGGSGGSSTQGFGYNGGVRIVWPGCARSFPSTRTADE